ncbi:substrate-binding domain-containing protein [Asticcacaulis sp. AC402]|uniref:substrate-binding domain-containing protein n=1 Tax=Asticcacaulis sp. AC402 TaxID=1282361 RepID=UPI0003C3DD88|nr:substrate-binding domain-containing protein [Asticcacaulis sp. AC402]ESQ73850.1 hypothetical protein ABAC402_17015 [Asticcacaulis sp. AC402]
MKKAVISVVLALGMIATSAQAATRVYVTLSRSETFIDGIRTSMTAEDAKDSEVELTIDLANNDRATQQRQVDEAIKAKYDAIVILSVDNESGQHAFDAAKKAGVPLVFVNTPPPIADVRGKVSIVACNDIVAGRLQMRLLSAEMNNAGNVVVIRGTDGHAASDDRSSGIKEILATRPNVKLAAEASAHWSRDEAEQLVLGWLDQGIRIDAIAANSDEMALGAVSALRKRGIPAGKVFVGGTDGTANGLNGVKSGDLSVTLLQNTASMAKAALNSAKTMATGGYAQQYEWVPYEIVLPTTVDRYTNLEAK